MALAVLAEIGRLLTALADSGATGAIDLRSLPLTAADRDQLATLLGRGEVRAELDLAGRSEVWESAYPGAWWIRHLGADGRTTSEVIAVCPAPEILAAHAVDIRAGAVRLSRFLEQQGSSRPAEPAGDVGVVGGHAQRPSSGASSPAAKPHRSQSLRLRPTDAHVARALPQAVATPAETTHD